jgi:hypothetical protein
VSRRVRIRAERYFRNATLNKDDRGDGMWSLYGYVVSPLGIIGVYSGSYPMSGGRRDDWTRFEFVHRGLAWSWDRHATFSQRGLKGMARRFARDVVAGRATVTDR